MSLTRDEKRILHGLYYHREMVGEEMIYTADEIRWLAFHSLRQGTQWQGQDGKLNSLQAGDRRVTRFRSLNTEDVRPLYYLRDSGFIELNHMKPGSALKIRVTRTGRDKARELHTFYGRLNARYRENKDSLIGLLITIIVAAVTALVTTAVTHRLHRADEAQQQNWPE